MLLVHFMEPLYPPLTQMGKAEVNTELPSQHDALVGRLMLLEDDEELQPSQRELASGWRERLEQAREHTEADMSVAFMAEVHQGKSTLVAAASGLRLGSGEDPRKWSVLPVGDGFTTLGETQLHFEARTDIAVEVEPIGRAQLLLELRLFAEDQLDPKRGARSGSEAGEELHRLFRQWLAPDANTPREARDAVKALVSAHEDSGALFRALKARLDIDQRTRGWSGVFSAQHEGLVELQTVLTKVMRGKLEDSPAPAVIHLRVPQGPLGALTTLVDTRGIALDGAEAAIESREDIRRRLDDPNTLPIICTEFGTGLGHVAGKLLTALRQRPGNRVRTWRLVIIDKRKPVDDDQAREAQRDEGEERREVCYDKLRQLGIDEPEEMVQLIDARDDADSLRSMIFGIIEEERARRRLAWTEVYRQAEAAIEHLRDHEFATRAREYELRLWWVWDAAIAATPPAAGGSGGLAGCVEAIRHGAFQHWGQVNAAARRHGRYVNFDLARAGAARTTLARTAPFFAGYHAVEEHIEAMKLSDEPQLRDHLISFRQRLGDSLSFYQFELYKLWMRALAERFESSESAPLWARCVDRWGKGTGYINDVAGYFAEEAERLEVELDPATLPDPIDAQVRRPALLELNRISLRNFRGIEDASIELGPKTTVLIGANGVGKTAWLEAIAKTVGLLLPGMGAQQAPALTRDDIRQIVADEGGGQFGVHPQDDLALALNATLQGRALSWGRAIDTPPPREVEPTERELEEGAVQIKAREIAADIGKEVRAHTERQLPVLAYYGTQRLWPPDLAVEDRRDVGSRLDGYRDCLDAASTHQHLLEWMRKQTMIELQRKEPVTQLQAIERAVIACIPEAHAFRYQLDIEDLLLVMRSGEHRLFRLLSDGYRNMVAMVADIAWRASRLNPQLGAMASTFVEGVVLIDEIDLHLHPTWQRRVLADIRRAFPRLQFVVTTHNPMVLASARRERIVKLELDEHGSLRVEHLQSDPRLATGTELYAEFFDVTGLYPSELGAALHRYGQLAVDPFRSDAEDHELRALRAKLEAEEIETHLEPVPREPEA